MFSENTNGTDFNSASESTNGAFFNNSHGNSFQFVAAKNGNSTDYVGAVSQTDTLVLRLCSAVEGVTVFILFTQILPSIFYKRHKSSFYLRLGAMYVLVLFFLTVRFYDFIETNIFRTMNEDSKLRFLLYCIGPLECVFDLSLVSLSIETIIDLTATYISERNVWALYFSLVVGIPVAFLFIMVAVWESRSFKSVVPTALGESIVPAVATFLLLLFMYFYARRRNGRLTEEQVFRTKLMVSVCLCETIGVVTNLILYLLNSEIVMDDLNDSIMKFCVCVCYLLVRPGSWTAGLVLTSLQNRAAQPTSSLTHSILSSEVY